MTVLNVTMFCRLCFGLVSVLNVIINLLICHLSSITSMEMEAVVGHNGRKGVGPSHAIGTFLINNA